MCYFSFFASPVALGTANHGYRELLDGGRLVVLEDGVNVCQNDSYVWQG